MQYYNIIMMYSLVRSNPVWCFLTDVSYRLSYEYCLNLSG